MTDEAIETIRYTADILAITDEPTPRILLIERGWPPHQGMWALPGGHVDAGETSRTAAARELAEETGIRLEADKLRQLGVWDTPDRDPRGRYVTAAYTATLPTRIAPVAGDDATSARWWPLNALPELAFDHADIIAAATGNPT